MNFLERPPPCGYTTSECDDLTCGSVVSTTAQDRNVTYHHIKEQVTGGSTTTQEAPKAHHSKKSRNGARLTLNGQHPKSSQPIANNWQYEDELSQKARVDEISP